MATVSLKNIQKIYPIDDGGKRAKKSGLKITEQGVVAVASAAR